MKALHASDVKILTDIPNIGKAMVHVFALLGITVPQDLVGKDPYVLYKKLCTYTGVRQDPCVLDTCMAVTDFMNGAESRPWWSYTKARKEKYKNI